MYLRIMNKQIENTLIPQADDKLLCVKVGKIARESIYEMSRKYWRVDGRKAAKATYVLAIIDGIVEAVFEPEEWFKTTDSTYAGRWEFSGKEVKDSLYIGKSVKAFYGKSANPVRYINYAPLPIQ